MSKQTKLKKKPAKLTHSKPSKNGKGPKLSTKKLDLDNCMSLIDIGTIERMMGEDRWKSMKKYIKSRYGTSTVRIGYTKQGPVVHLKCPSGERLGTIAEVETAAMGYSSKSAGKKRKTKIKEPAHDT